MGAVRQIYKMAFLVLLGSAPARAELPAPLQFNGQYLFTWNGITLGGLALGIDETAARYRIHLAVRSLGLVNWFTRHSDDTITEGNREGGLNGSRYRPLHYESFYKTKNKPRHILVNFTSKGVVTDEINEPPDKPGERQPAPHALKDGAYDPLSLLMELRSGTPEAKGFDGKRVFNVKAAKGAPTQLSAAGKDVAATPLVLSRTPLAGLSAKESAAYAKGEPVLALYVSDDARRIPVGVSVPLFFGRVRGTLTRECPTWDACKLP